MIRSAPRTRLLVVTQRPRTEGENRARRKHVSPRLAAAPPLQVVAPVKPEVSLTTEPHFPESLKWLRTAEPSVREHFLNSEAVRASKSAPLQAIVAYYDLQRSVARAATV
jgi:hypothetical protein